MKEAAVKKRAEKAAKEKKEPQDVEMPEEETASPAKPQDSLTLDGRTTITNHNYH